MKFLKHITKSTNFTFCKISQIILVLFTIYPNSSIAQNQTSGLVKIQIPPGIKEFELKDSLIVPGSLVVFCNLNQLSEGLDYKITKETRLSVVFEGIAIEFDKVLYYRLFYPNIFSPVSKRNTSVIQKIYNQDTKIPNSRNQGNWGGNEINVTGVISRGVGVGNAQNVSLNSALNIQITGKLDNDIEISAAVSDEQYPIQPEGTTLQVQDFDKVYVQLSKKDRKLIFGDFLMETDTTSYFLKYYKKSRGINYSQFKRKGAVSNSLNTSAAISRGRFSRNEIAGIDGVQGPYRLKGINDEQFLIVISGTETVHLDGVKLIRGLQNDYVIDYNTGEILFNTNHLITGFSRIVVEFQYADRNYSRSVVVGNLSHKISNFEIDFRVFNEKDMKNQPLQQDLNIYDSTSNKNARELLENAGDNPDSAVITNVKQYSYFDNTSLNYIKKDSAGFVFYRFVEEASSDSFYYKVEFSYLGVGKGNYRIKQGAANGRVFEFIYPIGGVKQGDYEPVVLLIAPVSLSVSNLTMKYSPAKRTNLKLELAGSVMDENTLSKIDDKNNFGLAVFFTADNSVQIKKDLTFKNVFKLEHSGSGFRYPERYRNVEFERQWKRGLINPSAQKVFVNENILSLTSKLELRDKGFLEVGLPYYQQSGISNLINPKLKSYVKLGSFYNENEGEMLKTLKSNLGNFEASSYAFRLGFVKNKTKVMAIYLNEISKSQSDSISRLSNISYKYNERRMEFNHTANRLMYDVAFWNRRDFQPDSNVLKEAGRTNNFTGGIRLLNKDKMGRLYLNLSYRNVQVSDSALSLIKGGNTLLSRIENEFHWLKNSVSWTGFLQSGNGREQKRQFTYLEVPVGTGYFAWVDYNSNGIKEINEFEVATFNDQARYVKLFLPTSEYITARYLDINQTLNIRPSANWTDGFLTKLENLTSISMNLKSLGNRSQLLKGITNPFGDSQTLTNLYYFRNTLFYNRADAISGAELVFQNNGSKQLLQNGFEERKTVLYSLNLRYNFLSTITLMINGEYGEKSYESEFFAINNYNYNYFQINPQLTWQQQSKLRVTLQSRNRRTGGSAGFGNEKGLLNDYTALVRFADVNSGQLEASFSYIDISFKGNASSPLGFDFMQGLLPGDNIRWGVGGKKRLGKNLLLDIQYNARKSSAAKAIHSGKMEVKYIF